MTAEELKASPTLPEGLSLALQALWHDAHGDWDLAHARAQEDEGRDGAWVHAYLHRREGDLGNAGYWYARARRQVPSEDLEEEWHSIAASLLSATPGKSEATSV